MSEFSEFSISSPDFEDGGEIPKKCGWYHENVNPSLKILVPAGAKSVVMIMDDPDAEQAVGKVWDHWILYNIDSTTQFHNTHNVIIPSGSTEKEPLTKKAWNDARMILSDPSISQKEKTLVQDANKQIISETMLARYGENLAMTGLNSYEKFDYGGPAPPDGKHTYIFKAYALDIKTLNLPQADAPGTKTDVEIAMKGHIIAEAKLTGTFTP